MRKENAPFALTYSQKFRFNLTKSGPLILFIQMQDNNLETEKSSISTPEQTSVDAVNLTPVSEEMSRVDQTELPVDNLKKRKALKGLISIAVVFLIAAGGLFFAQDKPSFINKKLIGKLVSLDGKQGNRSVFGYLDSLTENSTGDVTITYSGVAAKDIEVSGKYYVMDGGVYLDLIEDHKYVDDFMKGLFEKEHKDIAFSSEHYGVADYYRLDLTEILGINDYSEEPKITSRNLFIGDLHNYASCDKHREIVEFADHATTNKFPLLQSGTEGEYLIDDGALRDEYYPKQNEFLDTCVLPKIERDGDKVFYDEEVRSAISSDTTAGVDHKITISNQNGAQTLRYQYQITSDSQPAFQIEATFSNAKELEPKSAYTNQPLIDTPAEFALTMEYCRHAPVVGNPLMDNTVEFSTLSTQYDYPSPLDDVFTCSTLDQKLKYYSVMSEMEIDINGTKGTLNEGYVADLLKTHEINNLLELYFKQNGKYPTLVELSRSVEEKLGGKYLLGTNGKKLLEDALEYLPSDDSLSYTSTYTIVTPNNATVTITKKNY